MNSFPKALARKTLNLINIARTGLSIAGLDRSYHKVFAIGFNKTATKSIHSLFKELGYLASLHGVEWRPQDAVWVHRKWQAFSDGRPQNFKLLDQTYPGSKFILNTRDLSEWLDSRVQHLKLEHSNDIHSTSPNWQPTPVAVEAWIKERNVYHLEIMEYFKDRPDDLLIVNFIRDPEAATRIAGFLGKGGQYSKPYERSTQKTRDKGKLKSREMIEETLERLGIDQSEWNYDLYCPSLDAEKYPPDTSLCLTSAPVGQI